MHTSAMLRVSRQHGDPDAFVKWQCRYASLTGPIDRAPGLNHTGHTSIVSHSNLIPPA
jgi:hypothetical protein